MGGGDLNLKKSWHPLLHSNQEKVWQAERKAIEEKKRFKELEKERKEERELQELRRLGGKIDDRVEWIYAAPAQGNGPSLEEQEAYLLGKKRVDQMFKEQDEKRLAALKASSAPGENQEGAAVNTFQALGGNANSIRDLAAKVREDPMLAIKKQELAALEAYRKDPARLRALHAEQQEKAEKAARKEERRRRREDKEARREARASGSSKRERSHSPDREQRHVKRERSYSPDRRDHSRRHEEDYRRPARRDDSPDGHRRRRDDSPEYRRPRSPDGYARNGYSNGHRDSYQRPAPRREYNDRPTGALPPDPEAAARLAAMTASAASLQAQRKDRVAEAEKRDAAVFEKEQAERARNAKIGDHSSRFVRNETSKAGEAGLANALRGARAAGARIDRD